jgi:hypothetical protein
MDGERRTFSQLPIDFYGPVHTFDAMGRDGEMASLASW